MKYNSGRSIYKTCRLGICLPLLASCSQEKTSEVQSVKIEPLAPQIVENDPVSQSPTISCVGQLLTTADTTSAIWENGVALNAANLLFSDNSVENLETIQTAKIQGEEIAREVISVTTANRGYQILRLSGGPISRESAPTVCLEGP